MIYRSQRVGQFGKVFTLYKIKTMRDAPGPLSTADDDPRITKLGRFLRKTKLDELPQIWNWIKGDLTLIGWRPEVPQYLSTIHPEVLKTKPGIIGLAQLDDFDEGAVLKASENPDKDYEEKIMPRKRELELYYVRNKCVILDLKIILATFLRFFGIKWRIIKK